MASSKDIRNQIHSVENTKKITKAMEMVAASKMRKAQDRMRASRPYSETIRKLASHVAASHPEYIHPYMMDRSGSSKGVGFIVITTDKGLCGGLNTNILRMVTHKMRDEENNGNKITAMAIGTKGLGYLNRIGARVVSHVTQLGDTPRIEQLIGPLKVLVDEYIDQKIDVVYLCYNKFINTMQQETVTEQILPLPKDALKVAPGTPAPDYLYEPDAASVIDELLQRYIEILVYQGITENNASEQSARMVAMKAASDNAGNLINDLGLVYNKTRQAAITTELTEIVSGAAAVSVDE